MMILRRIKKAVNHFDNWYDVSKAIIITTDNSIQIQKYFNNL